MEEHYTMRLLNRTFAICRLDPSATVPDWAQGSFTSFTRTKDELSIVCEETFVPEGIRCARSRAALMVEGPLDFAITGLLANISSALSGNGISLFAVSTYDTDYMLIGKEDVPKALQTLEKSGFTIKLD